MNSMLEKLRQWHENQLYGFQDSTETRRLPYVMVIIQ